MEKARINTINIHTNTTHTHKNTGIQHNQPVVYGKWLQAITIRKQNRTGREKNLFLCFYTPLSLFFSLSHLILSQAIKTVPFDLQHRKWRARNTENRFHPSQIWADVNRNNTARQSRPFQEPSDRKKKLKECPSKIAALFRVCYVHHDDSTTRRYGATNALGVNFIQFGNLWTLQNKCLHVLYACCSHTKRANKTQSQQSCRTICMTVTKPTKQLQITLFSRKQKCLAYLRCIDYWRNSNNKEKQHKRKPHLGQFPNFMDKFHA